MKKSAIVVALFINVAMGVTNAKECSVPAPFRALTAEEASRYQDGKRLLATSAAQQPIQQSTALSKPTALDTHLPRVVNLWATWCEPCRRELPFLQLLNDNKVADVQLLNIEDGPEDAEKVLATIKVTTLKTRYAKMELLDELDIQGLPASVVFHGNKTYLGVGVLKHEARISDWLHCLNQ